MFKVTELKVGDKITVKNGSIYAVVADDNGALGVINVKTMCSNAIEFGTNYAAVAGSNSNGGRTIVKVERFNACPARNRLSETLKIGIGRPASYDTITVWELENPEVTRIKNEIADAELVLCNLVDKIEKLNHELSELL